MSSNPIATPGAARRPPRPSPGLAPGDGRGGRRASPELWLGWRLLGALGLLLVVAVAQARISIEQVEDLLAEHGPAPIIDVLLEAGNARMSVEMNGTLADVWGRPRQDLVSAASLARDIERAGMDLDAFRSRLRAHLEAEGLTRKRLSGDAAGIRADIPLASLDPTLQIWSPSRRWTVRALIEDADKRRRGWPADLNELRMREAYNRNRSIERVLLYWQSRYGSAEMSRVQRELLKAGRDRLYACRRLHRKRQREQWQALDCDEASRWNPSQVQRELKDALRVPFERFNAAIEPSLQRWKHERGLMSIY